MRVAAVQMQVGASKDENVARALRLIDEAAGRGARLIMLPEYVTYMGPPWAYAAIAEPIPGPTSRLFAAKAREHGVAIHCGSLVEPIAGARPFAASAARFHNTSFVVDPNGAIGGIYRKVHLFDVSVDAEVNENESADIAPGDGLVTVELAGLVLGMSICYDLRFPEGYRALALAQATVMAVPAAFAAATGRAHWEVLLRARAIENGAFVVAAAQHGTGAAWPMHGHSMIVDPWGVVLAELPAGDGVIMAEIDPGQAERRRRQIPVLAGRRPGVYAGPVRKGRLAFCEEM
jgi:predicted amidohydrolase